MRGVRAAGIAGLSILAVSAFAGTRPAAAGGLPVLAHHGRWLTDPQGRVVMVRGVQEWGPNGALPGPLTFGHKVPSTLGYGADDAGFLADNGFNAMRLSLSYWEYAPGQYDDTYLDGFAAFVRQLDDAGVYSLLDLQQAIYGPHFSGGEGFPEWMTLTDGVPNLPDAGYPNSYFVNSAQNRAWDNFWANGPASDGSGLQDHFAQGWRHLAQRLKDLPGILGYDLLNEPWPGSVWSSCSSPTGCPPGGFDDTSLSPSIARVLKAIREADRSRLVVYEPNLLFDFGADTRVTAPGDPSAVFGFHNYCLGGAAPGGSESDGCAVDEDRVFQNAVAYASRTGDGLLLGEWGGTSGPVDTARLADMADRYLLPWMNWWYGALVHDPRLPPTGDNVDAARLKLLVRPYPQLIAGTPTEMSFDPATRLFSTAFTTTMPDGRRAPAGITSEIFIPRLHYANRYRVEVTGAEVVAGLGSQHLVLKNCTGAAAASLRIVPGTPTEPASCAEQPVSTHRHGVTIVLPGRSRTCARRRTLAVRISRRAGVRIASATIYLNGRRVRVVRGRALRRTITLRNLPRGRLRLKVVVRTTKGRRLVVRRTYAACGGPR
jgi:endoglycosylceramidase